MGAARDEGAGKALCAGAVSSQQGRLQRPQVEKYILQRERVWLEASLRTEQVLCLSSLQLPAYVLPQGMLMLVFPKSSAGDAGRLQVWIPGEFEIQTGS